MEYSDEELENPVVKRDHRIGRPRSHIAFKACCGWHRFPPNSIEFESMVALERAYHLVLLLIERWPRHTPLQGICCMFNAIDVRSNCGLFSVTHRPPGIDILYSRLRKSGPGQGYRAGLGSDELGRLGRALGCDSGSPKP